MISFISHPPKVILAGMPAWYQVRAIEGTKLIIAEIYDADNNLIARERAFADQDRKASFELSEYIFDALDPQTELTPTDHVFINENIASLFKIVFLEDDDETGTEITHHALKGVLNDDVKKTIGYASVITSYYNYLRTTKAFLSFAPDIVDLHDENQPEKLHFMITDATIDDVDVKVELYGNEGTLVQETAETIAGVNFGDVIEINPAAMAFEMEADLPEGESGSVFTVELYHNLTAISVKKTYLFRTGLHKNINHFLFLNPAGGFDCFTATGQSFTESDYKPELVKVLPSPGQDQQQLRRMLHTQEDIETVHTGFLSSDAMQWLSQMVASHKPFWLTSGKLAPILFTNAGIMRRRSVSELKYASVSFYANLTQISENVGFIATLNATVTVTNATCHGGASGKIEITAPTGGSGSYQYSKDNGNNWQESGTFDDLEAGVYRVAIRDQLDTLLISSLGRFTVKHPIEMDAEIEVTDTLTGSDIGAILFNLPPDPIIGEVLNDPAVYILENYEFSINGGSSWQSSNEFTGLGAGTYDCRMREAANPACVKIIDEAVVLAAHEPEPLTADVDHTDVSCSGANDGSIIITNPAGGSGIGYRFSIDDGATWHEQTEFFNLEPGSYVVKMRDNTGTIETLDNITISVSGSHPNAPINLQATPQPRGVLLSWDNQGGNDTGVQVYFRPAGQPDRWQILIFEIPDLDSLFVEFAPEHWGVQFEMRIAHFNACGASGYSDTVRVAPQGVAPTQPQFTSAIQGNQFGTPAPCYGVRLQWTPIGGATFYQFRRSSDTSPLIYNVTQNTAYDRGMENTYTDGVNVQYQVRAGNAFGVSEWSNAVSVFLVCSLGELYDPDANVSPW
jgi:hypothetical protein